MSITTTRAAADILDQIHQKCNKHLPKNSMVLCDNFVRSDDMDEYITLIDNFINAMPLANFEDILSNSPLVDVNNVIQSTGVTNEGFKGDNVCSSRKCQTNFLAKRRHALSFITHILQDIVLFTNTIRMPGYYELYMQISFRERIRIEINDLIKEIYDIENLLIRLEDNKYRIQNGLPVVSIPDIDSMISQKNEILPLKRNNLDLKNTDMNNLDANIQSRVEILRDVNNFHIIETDIRIRVPHNNLEVLKQIRMLLRKIIYLRKIDNICNLTYDSDGVVIENDSKRIHEDWIRVLENIFNDVNGLIITWDI